MYLMTLATCALNQWALDWEGNRDRIIASIMQAKAKGATIRVGPELEVSGYSCWDHFLEADFYLHEWEMLAQIINDDRCQNIVLDIGMAVRHQNCRYNCRVVCYNRYIYLIRPKKFLAQDGNYYEGRWFTPWLKDRQLEDYYLESIVGNITGQTKVPIGEALISTIDTCFGAETCEEMFLPDPPHGAMSLNGCEIFTNSSGSHHELRKFDTRRRLIENATRACGGVYLYSNQIGCDGNRLYFDGCAMIFCNGELLGQGPQFSTQEVIVVTATVDIELVRSFRSPPSRGMQAQTTPNFQRIEVPVRLSVDNDDHLELSPSPAIYPRIHTPEEEIAFGPALWLWDYLRRSHSSGFFIPLSGGIDSASTACLVYSMCRLVVKAVNESKDEQVLKDIRVITKLDDYVPPSAKDLCNKIFCTAYMGTNNSSQETRRRAKDLSNRIGAYHLDINIQTCVNALKALFTTITGFTPKYSTQGGSAAENLALQNIQARLRMVISYLFAQLIPTVRFRRGGSLLVLGSANVDESLRGYLTKYDCSAADINPIGGISKIDLKSFIAYARDNFDLPILQEFLDATPTAELIPIPEANSSIKPQSDEEEMGITYKELSVFGRLRKVAKLGPWGMYERLSHEWASQYSPREVGEKVKLFFYYYAINRHKMTVLTPSYHAEQYSPEDNRYDMRPFLYPSWSWPFKKIDKNVTMREEKLGKKPLAMQE